jgi:alpha-tubulin suppressor-like RCC1 family protein
MQSQKDIFLPKPINQTLKGVSQTAKWISSGSHHSAIVTKAGELFVCGSQLHGKLGIPSLNVMHLTKFQQINFTQKVK